MSDDAPKPLPFTKHPSIQAEIRSTLRELLDKADAGELVGLFIATIDKDEECVSTMVGEQRFSLAGAAFVGLVRRCGQFGVE